jgi:hypothetical protein
MKYPLITLAVGLTLFLFVKLIQYVTVTQTQSCGGFMGERGANQCPVGFHCKYPANSYPDAGGTCSLF